MIDPAVIAALLIYLMPVPATPANKLPRIAV